jgi:hypothetical protein
VLPSNVARAPVLPGDRRRSHQERSRQRYGSGRGSARRRNWNFLQQAKALTEPEPMPPPADELSAVAMELFETSTTPLGGTTGRSSLAGIEENWSAFGGGEFVYLHTTEPEDFRAIEGTGAVLRSAGYVVGDTIFTRNNTQGDVFFFAADRRAAECVKSVVEAELQTCGYPRPLQLRDGRKFRFAAPRKIEVWLPG